MACDFCKGIECHEDEEADITVYIAFDNSLEIDDSRGNTTFMSIRYCPMCGQDMREATHADS